MTLCFYYHADRTGGSSAYHWIASNYYDPKRFLINGIYSAAQKLLEKKLHDFPELKGKSKLSGFVTKSIKSKDHSFDKFLCKGFNNEIDILLHFHNQNIIDFSVLRQGLTQRLSPKIIFSIRSPIKQLSSIYNARRYFELSFSEFMTRTKHCHYWNTMTYQLISCILTVSSIRGNRTYVRSRLKNITNSIKKANYKDAIDCLLSLSYELDIVFIETRQKKEMTTYSQINMIDMLNSTFINPCKLDYFSKSQLRYNEQTKESRKMLSRALFNQLAYASKEMNILDNLLYGLSVKTQFFC